MSIDRGISDFSEDIFLKLLESQISSNDPERLSNENIELLVATARRIAAVYWAEAYPHE